MRIGNRKKMKTETEEAYQLRMREYDRKALKESITTEAFSGLVALGWLGFIGGIVVRVLSLIRPYSDIMSGIVPLATLRILALVAIGLGFVFIGLGQLICIKQLIQKMFDVQKYKDVYGESPYKVEGDGK